MKCTDTLLSAGLALSALTLPSLATTLSHARAGTQTFLSYDPAYDAASASLSTVACSNGVNGLESLGYTTFGSVPGFPYIGGSPTVAGWNSPNCGKCYELSYTVGSYSASIYVTAIDAAPGGFNIGLQAMNKLTNGNALELGRVPVDSTEVDQSLCEFK